MKAKNAHPLQWGPAASGLVAVLVTAGMLLASRVGSEDLTWARVVPAFVLLNGTLVAAFHARRLWSLLAGMTAGIITGVASTWGLIGQPVEGLFSVVTFTLAFFVALGLLLGGFIEFVLYVHHLAHGRPPREYQKAPSPPAKPQASP